MNIRQLQQLAWSVGFPSTSVATAAAVAFAESGGNPGAVGDTSITPGGSVGLWQINLASHPQYTRQFLLDPVNNAKAALAVSQGGSNWNPWTTYRTGVYRRYLSPFGVGGGDDTSSWLLAGSILAGAVAAAVWMNR